MTALPLINTHGYQVAKHGIHYSPNGYGMYLLFHNEAEVSESHFTITPQTLITRIGGVMGVGQILTWLLIRIFDYFLIVYIKLKESQFYQQFNQNKC